MKNDKNKLKEEKKKRDQGKKKRIVTRKVKKVHSPVSLLSHLEVAPRGVPLPSVEEVGRSHVVPGGVAWRELDLRDHVLKEPNEHHDLIIT